jgi:hypothetical protein
MLGIKRITGAADLASEGQPGSWVSEAAREKSSRCGRSPAS